MRELRSGAVPAARSKLKVMVRLDVDMAAAHIRIRGTVTERNLGAVYAVVRRACTFAGGMAVVLDLRQAVVGAVPMADLHSARRTGQLPPATGPASVPCRLEVLEPAAA
ncbi:hypothetical protein E4J89_03790 [Arthrobacter sp. CAU 1506]|uniref:hypothetical protein n=1 Tax=Arthrobacter sp. CAU 1506 TaxID=2560052 RepID=UPI0010AC0AC3|nr:hypothetical protein [Arthrobacter sp. CAU 1506]TJY71388.1 hypothetical protein E4J89_03790 [Arthrobacter sp. CAU 1506]